MRIVLGNVLGIVLLAGAASAAPRDDHAWADRTRYTGKHFVVETDSFPEIARDLGAHLDRVFALYEDRFGPLGGRARRPMRIQLHRTRDGYLKRGEGVAGALGHFDPSLDLCSLAWSGEVGGTGWPIAVHEACHHYLFRRFGRIRLPSWYSEGIACWFEGLQDATTSKRISRIRDAAARAALRDDQARLDLVLETNALVQRGRLAVAGMTPSRYYGLAWSLVHFLATDPRYRDAFRRFEMRLFAGWADDDFDARGVLAEECGPLDTLEERWRLHLAELPPAPAVVEAQPYRWELSSDKAFVRYAALRRVRSFPVPEKLRDGVLACLRDGDVAVRTEATRVLQHDPREEGAHALLASLDWGDETLKEEALRALAHPVMKRAVPRLLLETEDRAGALRALAGIGDARALPALREAALDHDLDITTRARCIRALGADPGAKSVLRRALEHDDDLISRAARTALVHLGTREDEDPTQVLAAAEAPVAQRDLDDLTKIALDPSKREILRVRACEQLAAMRARAAVPALRRLCRVGVVPTVRLEALRALVAITGETRGYAPGQSARDREAAFRAWSDRAP